MEKLSIQTQDHTSLLNTKVVVFDGDFDGYAQENVTELKALIDNTAPKTTLIFDFAKLNFMNSYAIGHLVAWRNQLAETEGKIVMVSVNKNVEEIFGIVGISNLFQIFPDLASAELELGKPS